MFYACCKAAVCLLDEGETVGAGNEKLALGGSLQKD